MIISYTVYPLNVNRYFGLTHNIGATNALSRILFSFLDNFGFAYLDGSGFEFLDF